MKNPVIALGLDAAHPDVLDRWISRGLLPNLKRLRGEGAFGKLESSIKHHRAETPWPVFLSGCLPEKTGYWTPIAYDSQNYKCRVPGYHEGAYDFKEYAPFYAGLGSEFPVAVFDMPQTVMRDDVEGVQVLGWGGHARMTPGESRPEALFQDLVKKFGENPILDKDSISPHAGAADFNRYMDGALAGVARKADIILELLKERKYSLLLSVFGETHSAHHYLWHQSQPHTVDRSEADPTKDPMLKIFQGIDAAIGRIADGAPENTNVVVFSVHGTRSNTGDLGANVFLPELLYRWNYPGKYCLEPGPEIKTQLPPPRLPTETSWWVDVWRQRYQSNRLKALMRKVVPLNQANKFRLERLTGKEGHSDLLHKPPLFWLPASWYSGMWKDMKAFALPSYSDGYIRLNLKGRDPHGVVDPADYNKTLDEITEMLMQVRDSRKGERLIVDVIRTRQGPEQDGPQYPEGDLVIMFDERDCPADTVEHSALGQIGPIPFNRTGGHYSTGFFLGRGPDIAAGSKVTGDAVGMAPTLLKLMGAPIPDYMDAAPLEFEQPHRQHEAAAE